MQKKPFRVITLFTLLIAAIVSMRVPTGNTAPVFDRDKLTAQEIIVKHLDSIGPAAARSKVTTRQVTGVCQFSAKLASGAISSIGGPAVFASDGSKSLIAAAFDNPTYPKETLAYDGNKFTTGYVKPGQRTSLGDFMISNKASFKEGLAAGTLSSAWPFWDLSSHDSRLETGGVKKINGRDAYVIKYSPKKGSDFAIRIYFDAETFQHVRTEYDRLLSALNNGGGVDAQSQQRETRYLMIEEFSDYKAEQGLTLPHTYKLEISIDGQGGTTRQTWLFNLNAFTFNEKIDPTAFNLEGAAK